MNDMKKKLSKEIIVRFTYTFTTYTKENDQHNIYWATLNTTSVAGDDHKLNMSSPS